MLEQVVQRHDWTDRKSPIHLGVVIRSLLLLTIDVTNLASLVEGDNAQRVQDYFRCLLQSMEVWMLRPPYP